MTSDPQPQVPADGLSAGAMLRAARERQGLHIAALAASIKVAPAKLDALENDRYQELPDATFTRALAQSVCRVLKIDARPVLDKMPSSRSVGLERVDSGLKTPFRERAATLEPSDWAPWRQPAFWVVLALLAAAAAFWLLPGRGLSLPTLPSLPTFGNGGAPSVSSTAVAPTATQDAAAAPAAPSAAVAADTTPLAGPAAPPMPPVSETVHSAPAAAAAGPLAADAPDSLLVMRSDEPSWVEVQDARNLVLFSRTLQPGETVGLNGNLPIRVKVGNAAATQVQFRGKPVDLQAVTRDNVARVELK